MIIDDGRQSLAVDNSDADAEVYTMVRLAEYHALRARIAELELYVDTLTNSTGAAITEAVARGQQREARIAELEAELDRKNDQERWDKEREKMESFERAR